jgi:hypothetical protein
VIDINKPFVDTKILTINDLYADYFKKRDLIFNTEYQRSEVWNVNKKQKLIDSIFKEYNIGMIFLRKNENNSFEVLDGQQRLKSIFQFIENEYPISSEWTSEIGEKKFSDIEKLPGLYAKFIAFKIIVAIVENANDETTSDIFLRLQEGMPLNSAEKLNAMRGHMHNVVLNLSKHPFIKNTGIKDHRFAHRLLAAQIFYLEMNSNFDYMNFPDIRFDSLKQMYEEYSFKRPKQHYLSNSKKYLNFFNKIFGDKASIINKRGDFIPLYLLYSYLDKKYVTSEINEDFFEFISEFFTKVEQSKIKEEITSPEEAPYREFKSWRSRGATSSKSFIERFRIILGKFLEFYPDIKLKDPKRTFDKGQKFAIYYRDHNVCQECGKELAFSEAEFDHIKPWSDGGQTIVSNGQLLCQKCNRKKSNN